MIRIAAVVVVLCLVGVVAVPLLSGDDAEPEFLRYGATSPAERELNKTLMKLTAAWNPNKKRRVIDAAKGRAAALVEPLQQMLERPRHPKLATAMYLCAELQLGETRPLIQKLIETAPRSLRADAVMAASRIASWNADDLRGLFANADLGVRIAALWCWQKNPVSELLPDVLALLEDRDPDIRRAALEALPPNASEEQRQRLYERVRAATGAQRVAQLHALGRIGLSSETEAYLTQCLWDDSEAVRMAALSALRYKAAPLAEPRPVVEVVSGDVKPREASHALYCLERTMSYEAADIRNRLSFVEAPLTKFFAARCLLARGDKKGAELLVDVLAACADGGVDEATLTLTTATRAILSRLTGRAKTTEVSEWRAAVDAMPNPSARRFDPLSPEVLRALGLAF